MRPALSLIVATLLLSAARAETPAAADFDNQLAKLRPKAAKEERLAVSKWIRSNYRSEHAPRAIPALEQLIRNDPESAVRREAVAALVLLVNRHDVPCPLGLITALRDPVDEVRWEASVLAGPYKRPFAAGALEALIDAATDERPGVRTNCLIHLAPAAAKDAKARAAIAKAKEDRDFDVRLTAHCAWFTATDDLAAFLTYIIRVREEPEAVLDKLAEGSEQDKQQRMQRNLFVLGSAARIIEWKRERPEDLAAALVPLLDHKAAPMRRGAAGLIGLSARKAEPRPDPSGSPFESPLSYLDPSATKDKPSSPPQPSKAYASLIERKADVRLRELAARDADETVRSAAKLALERFAELPEPLRVRPREVKP